MSNQIKDISFTCHSVRGTHKIQLLKYSFNVQRALAVKLSLKSKRESEKKRELGNRHLMHVLTLTGSPTRAKCAKPGGRQTVVESSLVAILINAFMNDNEWMQYRREKKRRNSLNWLCFTARRSKPLTTCDGFATVFIFDDVMPPSRSLFHLRSAFLVAWREGDLAETNKQAQRFATTSKYFV